jgi:hypothetical protein
MLIYYFCLSILIIILGHLCYEYYTTHINKPKHVNLYNDISNHYLKISEDLIKEENNRQQMKNDLKEYLKTCV